MDIPFIFNSLVSGKCFTNFTDKMSQSKQIETILKTAVAAVVAGILTNVVAGAFVGVAIAAVVGIGAFAYFTADYGYIRSSTDAIKGALKGL